VTMGNLFSKEGLPHSWCSGWPTSCAPAGGSVPFEHAPLHDGGGVSQTLGERPESRRNMHSTCAHSAGKCLCFLDANCAMLASSWHVSHTYSTSCFRVRPSSRCAESSPRPRTASRRVTARGRVLFAASSKTAARSKSLSSTASLIASRNASSLVIGMSSTRASGARPAAVGEGEAVTATSLGWTPAVLAESVRSARGSVTIRDDSSWRTVEHGGSRSWLALRSVVQGGATIRFAVPLAPLGSWHSTN